jgi:hypothetical protein
MRFECGSVSGKMIVLRFVDPDYATPLLKVLGWTSSRDPEMDPFFFREFLPRTIKVLKK